MYTYKIDFVFDSAKKINYSLFPHEFEKARVQFNDIAKKRNKEREIKEIKLFDNFFSVILDSSTSLDKPSKSLVKFTQFLIGTGKFNEYIKNKHLLRSKFSKDISDNNTISDAKFLNTLILWIINDDKNESASVKENKRNSIEEMKKLMLNTETILVH